MNTLTGAEKATLSSLFNQNGWTDKIASSHANLELLFNYAQIEIDKYRIVDGITLSKGKTLDNLWNEGSDSEVISFLRVILEILKTKVIDHTNDVVNRDIEVVEGILSRYDTVFDTSIYLDTQSITVETLMPQINRWMNEGNFILSLEKIHTLYIHLLKRKLKDYVSFDQRHNLNYLITKTLENYDLSDIEIIQMKNDINFSKVFDNARNNGTFTHDNEGNLINLADAKILSLHFVNSIQILDKLA